jgi:hypothetical protein
MVTSVKIRHTPTHGKVESRKNITEYNDFVSCSNRVAIYQMTLNSDILSAPPGRACGTIEDGAVLLCASCLEYVVSCERMGLPTAWRFALEIRKTRDKTNL